MRPTILIVEDQEPVRRLLGEWLGSVFPGVEVVGASSGEEGVASVQTRAPGVVLMDIGLPGMSGIEAVRRIKAVAPHTRIVMLTALNDEVHRREAFAAGASAYVPKGRIRTELIPVMAGLLTSDSALAPDDRNGADPCR